MQRCATCGAEFEPYPVIDGAKLNLHGRQRCLSCLPLRRLKGPRKPALRPQQMKMCERCGALFPTRIKIQGRVRNLKNRRFCLDCSPFGIHNTSRTPPGQLDADGLKEHRRRRRNAKSYRHQKKKRRSNKQKLIELAGGACVACGYAATSAALEFHHRNSTDKEFGIGGFTGSWARLVAEAEKCDLLCANCHRSRHASEKGPLRHEKIARERLERKKRAVFLMGGLCQTCGRAGPPSLFEFHHKDASTKSFGISEDGILRSWAAVVSELAKCVMLCANCHREVHAGARTLQGIESRLAEDALPYAA